MIGPNLDLVDIMYDRLREGAPVPGDNLIRAQMFSGSGMWYGAIGTSRRRFAHGPHPGDLYEIGRGRDDDLLLRGEYTVS